MRLDYQAINFTRRLNQVYDVNFLDMAVRARLPFTPQPLRDAGLALVLGVVVGAMLVILTSRSSD
jgi:capsular polysaccharide biosynthesis protein